MNIFEELEKNLGYHIQKEDIQKIISSAREELLKEIIRVIKRNRCSECHRTCESDELHDIELIEDVNYAFNSVLGENNETR